MTQDETWKRLGSLIQCKLWLVPKPLSLNKRLDLMYSKLIEKAKQSNGFDYEVSYKHGCMWT